MLMATDAPRAAVTSHKFMSMTVGMTVAIGCSSVIQKLYYSILKGEVKAV